MNPVTRLLYRVGELLDAPCFACADDPDRVIFSDWRKCDCEEGKLARWEDKYEDVPLSERPPLEEGR